MLIVGLPAGDVRGNGVRVCRSAAADRRAVLSGGAAHPLALFVAAARWARFPALLIGTYILRLLSTNASSPIVVILLGLLLTASSSVTFIPRVQNQGFARKNSSWLPWLALPIGVEAGFSSAGAGALGTVLLLNYSEMTPPEVVGHRHSVWAGAGRSRQRVPLEIRRDQQPGADAAARGRNSRSGDRMLAG